MRNGGRGFLHVQTSRWAWEIEGEKKLTRQNAQIGTTFIGAASRALARGFLLLLLFPHQSLAGAICSCNHPGESEHACCRRAKHDNPAVETHLEGSDTHSSHCASREAPAPCADFDYPSHGVGVCCQSAQDADAQAVAVSATEQLPVEKLLPPVWIDAQTIIAPASVHIHPHRQNLPLYLAFSCWLI